MLATSILVGIGFVRVVVTGGTTKVWFFKGLVGVGTLLVSKKNKYVEILKKRVGLFLKGFSLKVEDNDSAKVKECWKDIVDYLL